MHSQGDVIVLNLGALPFGMDGVTGLSIMIGNLSLENAGSDELKQVLNCAKAL
jgi:hypothetical protein